MISLKSQAIQTALLGDWEAAIRFNKELLKENSDDVDALNRLGFAYTAVGKIKEAKTAYNKVLKFDNQNQIALRNLKRLRTGETSKNTGNGNPAISQNPSMFIEETGKTKIVELVNIAQPKTILHLRTGETVELVMKRLKIFVLDSNRIFIGMLPDNIGRRLTRFLEGGNLYDAYIKSVNNHRVVIFIREKKRASRFKRQPSFLLLPERNQFVLEKTESKSESKKLHSTESDDESL